MYIKCGDFSYSVRVFVGVSSKDLVIWKIMIRGCNYNDYFRKVLVVFF